MSDSNLDGFLDFLQDPVFILAPSGTILQTNTAAKRLIGNDPTGRNLSEAISSPEEDFHTYLRRCSGTASPLLGTISIARPDRQTVKLRAYGARLAGAAEPVRLALRCVAVQADEFSLLAKKVQDLNAEIHERRRTQAALEETIRENNLLMRELHHRVKNNIQLMMGLFSAAQRETDSPEIKSFLKQANQRLMSIGTAQHLMYQSSEMREISIRSFIDSLCEAIRAMLGPHVHLNISASNGNLSNEVAFPLALILNELLTNAYKHGLQNGHGTIQVALERNGPEFTLIVHDNGLGFSVGPERRSSGLGLVRGLCRQIGGALQVENVSGARCVVRFTYDENVDQREAS